MLKEGFTDTGAFLVDGVLGRVGDVANAVFDVAFYDSVADLLVEVKKFVVIVVELLERYAFRVSEEKQENRFRQWRHGDFQIVVVWKEDSEIFIHDQAAQSGLFLNEFVQKMQLHASFPQFDDSLSYLIRQISYAFVSKQEVVAAVIEIMVGDVVLGSRMGQSVERSSRFCSVTERDSFQINF